MILILNKKRERVLVRFGLWGRYSGVCRGPSVGVESFGGEFDTFFRDSAEKGLIVDKNSGFGVILG